MQIQDGKLYLNRTWKYIYPALRVYGFQPISYLNDLIKQGVGIHDINFNDEEPHIPKIFILIQTQVPGMKGAKAKEYEEEFEAAMSDDFNTALATSSMFGLAKEINIYYQSVVSRDGVVCQEALAEVKRIFSFMTEVIGILEKAWEGQTGANAEEYDELMQVILAVRQDAREQKQWGIADCIRDRLAEIGITIEDSPQGARWKKREI